MESINGNIKYKFIPYRVVSFSKIEYLYETLKNDSFEKHRAITEVEGDLIICNDTSKMKNRTKQIIQETYEEYLDFIAKRDIENDRWIYNIIDGLNEQNSIIYCDNLCLIVPSFEWDGQYIDQIHLLTLPIDKKIRCLRDLRQKDIPLLEHMKKKTLINIEERYKLTERDLKILIHYTPSTYHLHIHFINVNFNECNSSIEYSHDLNMVIFNLQMDNEYYKKIKLNREIEL
jgi:m7GpppX diphosphatase